MFLSIIGKFFNNVGGFDRSILGITCDGTISSASGKNLWTSSPMIIVIISISIHNTNN